MSNFSLLKSKLYELLIKRKLELENIIWLTIDKLLKLIAGFFIGVYVARYLGPSEYGTLNLAKSIYIILTPVSIMGLQQIIVREILNKPKQQKAIIGSGIILSSLGSLFSFIVLIIISWLIEDQNKTLKHILIILSFAYLFKPIQVLSYVFEAEIKSKYNVLSINIAIIFAAIFKLLLISIEAKTVYFAYSFILDGLIYGLVLLWFSFRRKIIDSLNYSILVIKELTHLSWPLIISSFSILIYMQIDKIMIGSYLTSNEVGIYSAASQISELFYFIPIILSGTLFPYLNKIKKTNPTKFDLTFIKVNRYFALISIFIVVVIVSSSSWIVSTLFGDYYIEAHNVLDVHIFGLIFIFLGVIGNKWLLINNFQKITMHKTIIALIINVILNLILLPNFGIIGCAYSTVISQMFSGIILNLISQNSRKVFKLQIKSIIPINA